MANINLMLDAELKAEFKSKLALEKKEISRTLRDFIGKFNQQPEAAIEFLYSNDNQ